MENGHEIDVLIQKYPKLFSFTQDTADYSLLAEWVSPQNLIVIDYGPEPDLFLVGKIYHEDYSLATQAELDKLAQEFGVKRPKYFSFNSIPELLTAVNEMKGQEGICLYSKKGQAIHKIKAAEYLAKHRFKENANIETVVDLFCEWDYPDYGQFTEKLTQQFDHECFTMVQGFVSKVCEAKKEVDKIIEGMKRFVEPLKQKERKVAAKAILDAYGNTNRSGFCFTLLDSRPLVRENIKKLLWQCLKD
jgi:hypothetical protein